MGRRTAPATKQTARTWKHVKADGALIDLAIYSRQLVYNDQPAVLLALMDITERKRAEARLAFMAQHDGLTGLPNRNLLRQQMDEMLCCTPGAAREKVAVLCSISTTSRRSTTRSAIGSATSCCSGVAERLRSTLREEDTLGPPRRRRIRHHPERASTRPEDAVLLARRLLEAIGEPYLTRRPPS